jgi:hypothetical protein
VAVGETEAVEQPAAPEVESEPPPVLAVAAMGLHGLVDLLSALPFSALSFLVPEQELLAPPLLEAAFAPLREAKTADCSPQSSRRRLSPHRSPPGYVRHQKLPCLKE